MARRRFRRILKENIEAYCYLAPAGVVLVVFWFFPAMFSLMLSFTNWGWLDTMESVKWVGLRNFARILSDGDFRQALWNTTNYVLYSVPLTIVMSLSIALLLNTAIRFKPFFRTAYFIPYITSLVAIAMVWRWIFQREFGLANYVLKSLHLGTLQWLSEPEGIVNLIFAKLHTFSWWRACFGTKIHFSNPMLSGPSLSMCSLIVVTTWRNLGYTTVIFLAGLQNIDKMYYEAAQIDGASPWQRFRHITFPLLSPTTFFVLIISMIMAYKMFVPVMIMTPNGGPDNTTTTVVFYLYEKAFKAWKFGYASAVAYVLFMVILTLTVIQNRLFGKRVHYD